MTTIDKTLEHDPRSTAPDIDRRATTLTVGLSGLIGGQARAVAGGARRAEGTGERT